MVLDVLADPGETVTVKVTVSNPADFDVNVRPIQNDFVAGDKEDGTPALVLEEDEFAPTHSLKRFMKPLESVALPAGKSATVDVVINVPADAQPGGYFGALRFAPVSPDGGGQVNMSASVASLILLRVNGEVPQKLTLTDFAVQQNGSTGTFFTSDRDLSVFTRFENEGGVQVGPIGKISVTKGGELVYDADFNDNQPRDMILPDSARRWSVALGDLGGFGKYEVTATFTYGDDNQSLEATYSFWIVPWTIIIGGGVVLALLIGLIVWFVYRRRNPKTGVALGGSRRR